MTYFYKYLVRDNMHFNDGQQQDAHMFFIALTELWPNTLKDKLSLNVKSMLYYIL